MNIPKEKALSFNIFYLIELFDLALEKVRDRVNQEKYDLLEKLAEKLISYESIVDGLEGLAREQKTNDLAIFLFDLIERANDYGLKVVYNSLPELAGDFVDLYVLLLEEQANVDAIKRVVGVSVTAEDGLSYKEFYNRELENAIERSFDEEDQKEITTLLLEQAEEKPGQMVSEHFEPLLQQASDITANGQPQSEEYTLLSGRLLKLRNDLKTLKEKEPELFEHALKNKTLAPVKESASPSKTSIDSLLQEYFQSEVNGWLAEVKTFLERPVDKLNSESHLKQLVGFFKNLKEVSMIHGYTGLELVAHHLVGETRTAIEKGGSLNENALGQLRSIFDEIAHAESFSKENSSSAQLEKLKAKVDSFAETMVMPEDEGADRATAEEPTPEKQPPEEKEEVFGPDATDAFNPLLKDFLKTITRNYNQRDLASWLDVLDSNSFFFEEHLLSHFNVPMRRLVEVLLESENPAAYEKEIIGIWNNLAEGYPDVLNDGIKDTITALIQRVLDENGYGVSEEQAHKAFNETVRHLQHNNEGRLKAAFTGGESQQVRELLEHLKSNCIAAEHGGYVETLEFFLENLDKAQESPFNEEIANEFESSFRLLCDRIVYQGAQGSGSDIVDVLKEVLQEQLATSEEAAEPVQKEGDEAAQTAQESAEEKEAVPEEGPGEKAKEVPEESASVRESVDDEEEDDLALFREEAREHLQAFLSSLDEFSKTQQRLELEKIENASHSIRAGAHLLNLGGVAKLSASIEDIAELFSQSDLEIPGGLAGDLEKAYNVLESSVENPETKVEEAVELMDSWLDKIMIQESAEKQDNPAFNIPESSGEKAAPAPEKKQKRDEKPLFSVEEEDEELQEIFKEESTNFITTIKESNRVLLDSQEDADAIHDMSHASHSLKSAAMMMGFSSVTRIATGLETIAEGLDKKEITFSGDLHDAVSDAVGLLEEMGTGSDIGEERLIDVVGGLEKAATEPAPEAPKPPEPEAAEDEEDEKLPENMREIFVDEARELLSGLNSDYLELEKMPESEKLLADVLRKTHTLKGSAYISKFNLLGDLSHKLEDYLQVFKQSEKSSKTEMLDPVFSALDLMGDMVDAISRGEKEQVENFTARLAEIDNKMFLYQDMGEAAVETKPAEESKTKSAAKTGSKRSDDENILRINTEYMDKLVDMASELMINQSHLGNHLQALKEMLTEIEGEKKQIRGADSAIEDALEYSLRRSVEGLEQSGSEEHDSKKLIQSIRDVVRTVNLVHSDLNKITENFEQNIGRIGSLSKILHNDILKTRMVPIENLFNRYPRAVRDMSKKQKKKVNLIIEDNNTEMDRAMVEGLSEPILHIIRNAIDHGLETPEERKAGNKPEAGTLLLKANQDKNQIVINIEDDGRGIDVEAVKQKAVAQNLADPQEIDGMSEAEVLDFIFYAGFSTRDSADTVSGRGIGLDAVANQLQKLKGNIRVKTEKNVGTTFSLRVPLTLVISQALMVKVNFQTIAIPVIAVQESVQYKAADIVTDSGKNYIRVRGRLLPFVYLGELLKFSDDTPRADLEERMAVVINDASVSMAVGIDEIIGRREIVIKNLGSHLQNVDYIAGGTILANGEVALILDYALAIRTAEKHFFGKVTERLSSRKSAATSISFDTPKKAKTETTDKEVEESGTSTPSKKQIEDRKPAILIVDDSNSVRNFVGSILERNGFSTIKSTNGEEALKKMDSEMVDLVITDLEMPKMHGFDLISNIRSQEKFKNLPIIILTGRAGMKHRQAGTDLGANNFLVKPFKEKDLLSAIGEYIDIE